MGLDMYLYAKNLSAGGFTHSRVSRKWYDNPDGTRGFTDTPIDPPKDEVVLFDKVLDAVGLGTFNEVVKTFPNMNFIEIAIQVGYWRKANAVHAWFVREVQDGVDDCREYYVTHDALHRLRDTCQMVLDTVDKGELVKQVDPLWGEYDSYPNLKLDEALAAEVLPTQMGFFFGDTNYGAGYVADLEDTIRQLDAVLNHPLFGNESEWSFEYHSSW